MKKLVFMFLLSLQFLSLLVVTRLRPLRLTPIQLRLLIALLIL